MDRADVLRTRDRIADALRGRLGAELADERADDIAQAMLMCGDGAPEPVVLQMLARDLDRAEASRVLTDSAADGAGAPARVDHPTPPAGVVRASEPPRRKRRETRVLGVWS